MSHYNVDADFFFTEDVPGQELIAFLKEQCNPPQDERIHQIIVRTTANDALDVRFVVDTVTYAEAEKVARDFLRRVESNMTTWLAESGSGSTIEDESLLLMHA